MVKFSIDNTSLKLIQDRLKKLTGEEIIDASKKGVNSATAVITKSAKDNARRLDDPETGRQIARNITRTRAKLTRNKEKVGAVIGVRSYGMGNFAGAEKDKAKDKWTPHWHLLEFGTSKMRARPFMRPALIQNRQKAFDACAQSYVEWMDRNGK